MAPLDRDLRIVDIKDKRAKEDILVHIANLGFVKDALVRVVHMHDGDLIVKIKDSRVAIGRDIAKKIMVEEM